MAGEIVHGEVGEFAMEYDGVLVVSSVALVVSSSGALKDCER